MTVTSPRQTYRVDRFKARFNAFLVALLILIGGGMLLYPSAASWINQYKQSLVIDNLQRQIENAEPDRHAQLEAAHAYNDALTVGALVRPDDRKAEGFGALLRDNGDIWPYEKILTVGDKYGMMGRIKIEKAEVDLPIYHGTTDEVLLIGAGHLEGTSLPVGGEGTRSVISAHNGMASATMFTHVDRLVPGDDITLEIFGEALVYRVYESRIILPEDRDAIRAEEGRDLLTLITCMPLGINTHRILVNAERIYPTPQKVIEEIGKKSDLPHFPWWIIWLLCLLILIALWLWWTRRMYFKQEERKREQDEQAAAGAAGDDDCKDSE